ncbi:MAG: hypothetical protein WKF87_09165 [Chryseolinea sp.]
MMLDNFFRINLPYGLEKIEENRWIVFNRNYAPIGWNSDRTADSIYSSKYQQELPIRTEYAGLDEELLLKIAHHPNNGIKRNDQGQIFMVFMYNDSGNAVSDCYNDKKLSDYFEKIKLLGSLKVLY